MALILVVDDEPGIREMVRAALRYDGHSVVAAASGEEALGILKKDSFDLLVTDLSMPGMSGVDLLRKASGYAESGLRKPVPMDLTARPC